MVVDRTFGDHVFDPLVGDREPCTDSKISESRTSVPVSAHVLALRAAWRRPCGGHEIWPAASTGSSTEPAATAGHRMVRWLKVEAKKPRSTPQSGTQWYGSESYS